MKQLLVIISGPTGIGKTATCIELAKKFNSEIISADSRQFFKELSIGTAVPSKEELSQVKHHFIHNLSIDTNYNASMFEENALNLLNKLFQKLPVVFMVGGSGLYIDAVCKGIDYLPTITPEVRQKFQSIYENEGIERIKELVEQCDPKYYEVVDRNNYKRMQKALEVFEITGKPYSSFLKNKEKERKFNILTISLDINREELYDRINKRVDIMMKNGLKEEAYSVWPKKHLTPLKTVGYKELFEHFENTLTLDKAVTQIKNHTRAYARRQLTWFRRNKDAHWFNPTQLEEMSSLIKENLQGLT